MGSSVPRSAVSTPDALSGARVVGSGRVPCPGKRTRHRSGPGLGAGRSGCGCWSPTPWPERAAVCGSEGARARSQAPGRAWRKPGRRRRPDRIDPVVSGDVSRTRPSGPVGAAAAGSACSRRRHARPPRDTRDSTESGETTKQKQSASSIAARTSALHLAEAGIPSQSTQDSRPALAKASCRRWTKRRS